MQAALIRLDRNPARGITSVSRSVYRLAIGAVASQAAMAGLRAPPRTSQGPNQTLPKVDRLALPHASLSTMPPGAVDELFSHFFGFCLSTFDHGCNQVESRVRTALGEHGTQPPDKRRGTISRRHALVVHRLTL